MSGILPAVPTTPLAQEPFDLVSQPDDASRTLRDDLQTFATHGRDAALRDITGDALDLVQQLLLLRRALVVLMEATGVEALALPFEDVARAGAVALRVRHDPTVLPNVLQVLRPGEGVLTASAELTATAPPGFDSDGEAELDRLRATLQRVSEALEGLEGLEDVAALVRSTLRR